MEVQLKNIDNYQILDRLGRGGMGTVFKAENSQSGKVVALKCLDCPDRIRLHAIRQEISALKKLMHPAIVNILDDGTHNGCPWYAMEIVEGLPLDQIFSGSSQSKDKWWTTKLSNPMPGIASGAVAILEKTVSKTCTPKISDATLSRIVTILYRICSPLLYIHQKGLIHCDLKPENILITEGDKPVIMDFGLSTVFRGQNSREYTDFQMIGLGTMNYMPPEQFTGAPLDTRSDLFSLGVIFYELLTGELPFPSVFLQNDPTARFRTEVVKPSEFVDGIPEVLDAIVLNLLHFDHRKRTGRVNQIMDTLIHLCPKEKPVIQINSIPEISFRSELHGREEVWDKVSAALTRAQIGMGSGYFVRGESGSGKTRFVMDLARYARGKGFEIFIGTNAPVAADHSPQVFNPLQTFENVFQTIADLCREGGEETERTLIDPENAILTLYSESLQSLRGSKEIPTVSDSISIQSYNTAINAVGDLFSKVANHIPCLLIIDDLQWADPMSLDVLNKLIETDFFSTQNIVFLGTYRSEECSGKLSEMIENHDVNIIDMEPLGRDDSSKMIRDILPTRTLNQADLQSIHKISEGNPLFIYEYLLALNIGQKKGPIAKPVTITHLPYSLKDVLQRRIDVLNEDSIEILRLSSVCGRQFPSHFLSIANRVNPNDISSIVDDLIRRRLLEKPSNETIEFRHDKVREFVYGNLTKKVRQEMHGIIAEYAEREMPDWKDNFADRLGFHWEKAGEVCKAANCFRTAARHHYLKSSLESADKLAEKALTLAADPVTHEWLAFRNDWAQTVLRGLGKTRQAHRVAEDLLKDAMASNDTEMILDSYITLSELADQKGDYTQQNECLDRGLVIAESVDFPYLLSTLLNYKGHCAERVGDLKTAVQYYNRASDILGQSDEWNSEYYGIMIRVAWLEAKKGNSSAAVNQLEKILEALKFNKDSQIIALCHFYLGSGYTQMGEFEKAEVSLLEAAKIYRSISNQTRATEVQYDLAGLMIKMGHLVTAEEMIQECLVTYKKYEMSAHVSLCHTQLGLICKLQGNFKLADKYYSDLSREHSNDPRKSYIAYNNFVLSQIAYQLGHLDRADRLMKSALEIYLSLDVHPVALKCKLTIARISINRDKPETIRKCVTSVLAELRDQTDRIQVAEIKCLSSSILRETGDVDTAIELMKQAYPILSSISNPIIFGMATLEMVKLKRLNGDSPDDIQSLIKTAENAIMQSGARCYLPSLEIEKGYLAHAMGWDAKKHLMIAKEYIDKMELGAESPLRIALNQAINVIEI